MRCVTASIPIPDDMIPEDARVEMDAKQGAGYFTVHCAVVLRACVPCVRAVDTWLGCMRLRRTSCAV